MGDDRKAALQEAGFSEGTVQKFLGLTDTETEMIDNRLKESKERIKAVRERYQCKKPSPEQLLSEGGYKDFVTLGSLLESRKAGTSQP